MSGLPRIAVLCNNRMAIPSIQSLHASGHLCATGVPAQNEDVQPFCEMFAAQTGTPCTRFGKENLKEHLETWLVSCRADYVFIMTFPWRIPTVLLNERPGVFYNFHYGPLPEMRGADPIFESIRQQKAETGITVHAVTERIDAGPQLFKQIIPLDFDMTHGYLCTQMSYLSPRILPAVLQNLQNEKNQTESAVPTAETGGYYKKPGLKEVCINWNMQTASDVHALVRACNPWNKGAYTQWQGWNIRIPYTAVVEGNTSEPPGTVLAADPQNGIRVQCKENILKIEIIYTDEGFMPGHRLTTFGIKPGDRFSNFQ